MAKTSVIDREIGSRLRVRRVAAGLDQLTLAERLSTTEQRIREFEAGQARVDPKTMRAICKVLNLQVGYFFELWTKQSEDDVRSAAE